MKRSTIIYILSALLILLWVYAALSKLITLPVFESQLARQPLPDWSTGILKWGLPVIELMTAALIYKQSTRIWGLLLSSFLMIAFTIYVLFALTGSFGDIPCSCAGIISELRWKGHFVFNMIFLIISLLAVILEYKEENSYTKIRLFINQS